MSTIPDRGYVNVVVINRFTIKADIVVNWVGAFGCDGECFATGEGDRGFWEEG